MNQLILHKDYLYKYKDYNLLIFSPVIIPIEESIRMRHTFNTALIYEKENLHDTDTVINKIKQFCEKPDYILAIEEYCQIIVSECRTYFNIYGIKYDEIIKYRDKLIMAQNLIGSSVNIPNFCAFEDKEDAIHMLNQNGKIVLKPRLGMSSKSMFIVDTEVVQNSKSKQTMGTVLYL